MRRPGETRGLGRARERKGRNKKRKHWECSRCLERKGKKFAEIRVTVGSEVEMVELIQTNI